MSFPTLEPQVYGNSFPATGHDYGLKQAKSYDASIDPFAATGAALDYLQKLHTEFNGDWLLALAAYNCGEGRVQREIDKNRAKGLPTTSGACHSPKKRVNTCHACWHSES